jgi:hypothetical protein
MEEQQVGHDLQLSIYYHLTAFRISLLSTFYETTRLIYN